MVGGTINKYGKFNKKELSSFINQISPITYIGTEGTFREEFKQIKIKGRYIPYLISSFGRVFSTNYRMKGIVYQLKTTINPEGYEMVNINYKNKLYGIGAHRLVAFTFLPKKKKKQTDVNHINGVKNNNYFWNLEWCTHHENITHAWENNLHPVYYGDKSSHHKFTSDDVREVCELITQNYKLKEISKLTNVSYDMIRKIYARKNWVEVSKDYDFSNYKYKKK